MSDRRAGVWLAGLVLGAVSGLGLVIAGFVGVIILVAALLLILINGPRLLAGTGLVTGIGLISAVLFARVGITCAFPAPGVACGAGDIWGWVAAAIGLFVVGLVGSALALRRTVS